MEQPQTLSAKAGAFDAVFFSGANAKGQTFIVAAERRKNRRINGIVYLEVQGVLEFFVPIYLLAAIPWAGTVHDLKAL